MAVVGDIVRKARPDDPKPGRLHEAFRWAKYSTYGVTCMMCGSRMSLVFRARGERDEYVCPVCEYEIRI